MGKIKSILVAAALLVGVWLIGYTSGKRHSCDETKMVADTLVVRDTHIIEKPVLVERTSKDTLLVSVRDTIQIRDSVFFALPMETKTYKGEEYYAEVSGYKPSLDRIEVYPKTMAISKTEITTKTVTKRHNLTIGLEANYSFTPYIPIYLEYSNMLHKHVGIYGRVFYDLPSQAYGVGLGVKVCVGW